MFTELLSQDLVIKLFYSIITVVVNLFLCPIYKLNFTTGMYMQGPRANHGQFLASTGFLEHVPCR